MARKIINYTVEAEGRDKGKIFLITEMAASKAEAWATRVLLALLGSSMDVPENFESLGMAKLAEMGLRALSSLKWEQAEPLLAEMFECVEYFPDPKRMQTHRPLLEDVDIEEIATRLSLRVEIWKLHMDFMAAVAPSFLGGAAAEKVANLPRIKTSRRS